MNWIYVYPFGRDVARQIFEQTLSLLRLRLCVLCCQTTKEKRYIRYNLQLKLTTEITKSTRTLVRLLTILDAFSSDFVKRGTCLFILYKNMSDI